MAMPGRKFSTGSDYRYGFNGKEIDNDVKGERNQQDYGMRIYDPRLGKFLSLDPLAKQFAWYSPYHFAGNTPIQAIDLDGEEPKIVITTKITGFTMIKVYGSPSLGIYPKEMIVVPTYEAKLIDIETNKVIVSFNVTRDAWYSRGTTKETTVTKKVHWYNAQPYTVTSTTTTYHLINRAFEPADGSESGSTYSVNVKAYPTNELIGFELIQHNSNLLKAVPFTPEMNKYLDGRNIDDNRANLSVASGVFLHIGGYYYNSTIPNDEGGVGGYRLAGSYGCFMYIPGSLTFKTAEEAQAYFNKVPPGATKKPVLQADNAEYSVLANQIKDLMSKDGNKLIIKIDKRIKYDTKDDSTKTKEIGGE